MIFVATKMAGQLLFFTPLSFVAVFGSGGSKIRDPGSGMDENQDTG
jgi:hypothetical protein